MTSYRYIAVYENWDILIRLAQETNEIFSLNDAMQVIQTINAPRLEAQELLSIDL